VKSNKQSVRIAVRQASAALEQLGRAIERLESRLDSVASTRNGAAVQMGPRRTRRISAEGREFLKTQGRYLGLVRHLPPRKRAAVMAIRAQKGYGPAIKEAVRLAGR
jgi:hypothetical protein